MKKLVLLSLLIGLMHNIHAQVDHYSLAQSNFQTYPDVSASSTTLWTTGDDEIQLNVPIGFNFYYAGKERTSCSISLNGAISFENQVSSDNNLSSTDPDKRNIIAPFWDNLILDSANNGYVAYETTGTSPQRKFKVSWKNVSHYGDVSHTMSFILELIEEDNQIVFYYDDCDTGANLNASIGFNAYDNTNTTFVSLSPNTSAGTPATFSRTIANNSIDDIEYPVNKRYYFIIDSPYNDEASQARLVTLTDPRSGNIKVNYLMNIGATDSGGGYDPTCANFQGGDVWFRFTAPSTGAVSIVRSYIEDLRTFGGAVYHNDINSTPIFCNSFSPLSSHINDPHMLGNLIPGDTYYVRMWSYGNNIQGITQFYIAEVEPNDEAVYALDIDVQSGLASNYTYTFANNTFAMDSSFRNWVPSCQAGYQSGDVWYKFIAPTTGEIRVIHNDIEEDWSSLCFAVYDSPFGNTSIACDFIPLHNVTPPYDTKVFTGFTPGQEYWLRTWDDADNNIGSSGGFYLTDNNSVGITDYKQLTFEFYPNPTTDVLSVSATSNIDLIYITNLLGQEVYHSAPKQKQTVLNIKELQNGVYILNHCCPVKLPILRKSEV